MALHHFFLEDQVLAEESAEQFSLRLVADDAKHARVVRLSAGEHLAVVDAAGDYFECEVVSFDAGGLIVRIACKLDTASGRPHVVLMQGLAKGEKMDVIIRHATELGVSSFTPLICDRSIVKLDAKKAAAKTERWRTIAKSAAMQSGQLSLPEVTLPQTVSEAATAIADATAVLVCWEEADCSARLHEALTAALEACGTGAADAHVVVVVGPEGGLTEAEVTELCAGNERASLVTLGPSILRTETAGIVAPALVLYELGGLS